MTDLYCAVCRKKLGADQNHVYAKAELKRTDDRDGMDEYAFHPECWEKLTEDWIEPA